MKAAFAGLTLITAACVAIANDRATLSTDRTGDVCYAAAARPLAGQAATSGVGAEALRRTGAKTVRWIRPGQMVTMDYSPNRLNIRLNAGGRIDSFNCG